MTTGMVLSLSLWDARRDKDNMKLGEPDLKVYTTGDGKFRIAPGSKDDVVLTPEQAFQLAEFFKPSLGVS